MKVMNIILEESLMFDGVDEEMTGSCWWGGEDDGYVCASY
jgi:hypothetical protein